MQVCYKCHQRGHWAADCTAEAALTDDVDMSWCVTDVSLLAHTAPANCLAALYPRTAALCGVATQCADPSSTPGNGPKFTPKNDDAANGDGVPGATPERADVGATLPDAGTQSLRQLMREVFGFDDFRSFQLPVMTAVLKVRRAPAMCNMLAMNSR